VINRRPAADNGREAALHALMHLLGQGRTLTSCLAEATDSVADPRDRSLTQELCYGVLRWLPQLDALLHRQLDKPLAARHRDIRIVLLLGLYQLVHTRIPVHAAVAQTVALAEACNKPWAKGLINGVLRGYLRNRDAIMAATCQQQEAWYAHPRWLIDAMQRAWPQDWDTILAENNKRPPMTLRVNACRNDRSTYLKYLATAHIEAYAAPHTTHGVMLAAPSEVDALPGFKEGHVSVQDGAAQLAAPLLDIKPGHRVLDACAAPGGKTAHMLECEPRLASLLAIDRDRQRLERVAATLERLGLQADVTPGDAAVPQTWWNGIPFERILLDAPCSATGVIRRHPDIKVLRRASDIRGLVDYQAKLLEALWPLLARGGLLLYATCSVLPPENAAQIARFLAQHPDARERAMDAPWGRSVGPGRQILPGADGMDGFFYALLEKQE
jgi:16S rRNA (cytosine967-C5)-methyltransferase